MNSAPSLGIAGFGGGLLTFWLGLAYYLEFSLGKDGSILMGIGYWSPTFFAIILPGVELLFSLTLG